MEIFYQGCEIAATIIETLIFLDFLTKLLGRKFKVRINLLTFSISFIVINLFMIAMNYLIPQYSAIQDIGVLILYLAYAMLFTRGTLVMKTITPALTITSILIINLLTAYLLSFIWKMRLGDLVIDRNIQRLVALVITKLIFFIITRVVIHLVKPEEIILKSNICFINIYF